MATAWMVRAGEGSYLVHDFLEHKCVAIGWLSSQDLSKVKDRNELKELLQAAYVGDTAARTRTQLSQVATFLFDMEIGDNVVTYDSETRLYHTGEIVGAYKYQPALVEGYPHVHPVKWSGGTSRDSLSAPTRNTLGAIQTIFAIPDAWNEIATLLKGGKPPLTEEEEEELEEDDELDEIRRDAASRSREFIKDAVQKLSWEDAQRLVAGILRAMGYKSRVSPPGSDRGKDVIASPDGLGLEQPRIRVEVKHRAGQTMGAPDVRSFIGALRQNDRGLYVSTGGFTREAHYEAERATNPVTLVDMDMLSEMLVENYEQLDTESRALVPLVKVYWPAG
ncbi:MAG TPA: restriction endonuclease [Verrucomicrobiae bacterium]|nr:restriction endonuclease [Verrucomicrobiae bacterium]